MPHFVKTAMIISRTINNMPLFCPFVKCKKFFTLFLYKSADNKKCYTNFVGKVINKVVTLLVFYDKVCYEVSWSGVKTLYSDASDTDIDIMSHILQTYGYKTYGYHY
jgi:hypothetical protein